MAELPDHDLDVLAWILLPIRAMQAFTLIPWARPFVPTRRSDSWIRSWAAFVVVGILGCSPAGGSNAYEGTGGEGTGGPQASTGGQMGTGGDGADAGSGGCMPSTLPVGGCVVVNGSVCYPSGSYDYDCGKNGEGWVCPSRSIPRAQCSCSSTPRANLCPSDAGTEAFARDGAADDSSADSSTSTANCGTVTCVVGESYCRERKFRPNPDGSISPSLYTCVPFDSGLGCEAHDCSCVAEMQGDTLCYQCAQTASGEVIATCDAG